EVNEGKVDVEKPIVYLSAEQEFQKTIAQANVDLDNGGKILTQRVKARFGGDLPIVEPEKVDLIDVAPNQIASIAASLIPFLEHDDANRALMGSNMQRQAVPLLRPEAPIVGTGLEPLVARDSRVLINAEGEGVVEYVDANEIVIRYKRTEEEKLVSFDDDVKRYQLTKFRKTNQSTCINLKPIVAKGEKVSRGQVLCEGYATQNGELALGRNLKVAFMPWKGYNFEDAIVISERVAREDIFTSLHIDEYVLEVRDTKRGLEELTNDIPNVSEEATRELDSNGLIRVGAEVKENDILIGKITPKGETDPSPEEKLLRAIFVDKAGDVKDASLKAPPSMKGVVIDKKLFSRVIKDKKSKSDEKPIIAKLDEEYHQESAVLKNKLVEKLFTLVNGKTSQGVQTNFKEMVIPKGAKFAQKQLVGIDYANINPAKWTTDKDCNEQIKILIHNYSIKANDLLGIYKRKKFALTVGDELPAGIVQLAKVYIAKKRKLKVGDKMAGRHGNKGIVARIVRDEDMPFLEDGTPVDIVLNPLGVPSRMNLGQIYETVLAWAGQKLNQKFFTPIFDGASIDDINHYTDKAGIPRFGRTYLTDGGTGERFDQPATVGIIYMLKLGHMVDDKMHARSIGPYSLITQQPLGGKAQFGGQRFGEMEVWALEAFGAANILQEILTIKSDDVAGRAKAYESIVKGENLPTPGIPESFNVLLHELRGLGLNISLD
ncbi:MAG: DNA-directed RNA polymerase subunit beta, partial [Bacteroidota bacterium]